MIETRLPRKKNCRLIRRAIFPGLLSATLSFLLTQCRESQTNSVSDAADPPLLKAFDDDFVILTSEIVKIQTFRDDSSDSEKRVADNLDKIRTIFDARIEKANGELKSVRIEPFEWEGEQGQRVFGYRAGTGPKKFSILTHLDTVPPGGDWPAFEPKVEPRAYANEKPQDFLTGRGSIDDKGPSVISLMVLEAAAKQFDQTKVLTEWTIESTFDTAEETDAAIPAYIKAVGQPELGVVYDAFWSVFAEKGIERPTFSLPQGTPPGEGLWIADFQSDEGPANQIPGSATARIEGADPAATAAFGAKVADLYKSFAFDDPAYRRAPMTVETGSSSVTLTTKVLGAQHGSAPDANRREGANPLVSLANFLAGLTKDGTLNGGGGYAEMANFMTWGWGTSVFGEKHPEFLQRHDAIFQEGNGTTWALTRVNTKDGKITLAMDVRYAQGHQSVSWDGKTEGLLGGESLFPKLLPGFVASYRQNHPESGLSFETANAYPPDIRNPDGPAFQKIDAAFQAALGKPCPRRAIGGGTDAKGNTHLIAAGALFNTEFGAPINYHGIDEAAPLDDLRTSARVLFGLLSNTVAPSATP